MVEGLLAEVVVAGAAGMEGEATTKAVVGAAGHGRDRLEE